jgi:hypothetical protein
MSGKKKAAAAPPPNPKLLSTFNYKCIIDIKNTALRQINAKFKNNGSKKEPTASLR